MSNRRIINLEVREGFYNYNEMVENAQHNYQNVYEAGYTVVQKCKLEIHCEENVSAVLRKIELEEKTATKKCIDYLILDHYIG
jgi:hypothetical protein